MFRQISVAAIALVAGISAAAAEGYGFSDTVDGHEGVTYFDLVRHLMPDAELVGETNPKEGKHPDAVGSTLIELRHVVPALAGSPPEQLVVQGVEAWPIRADGREYLMIMLRLGHNETRPVGTSVLGLFDAELTLVDAAEVGLDVFTYADYDPILVGPDRDALVLTSQYRDSVQRTLAYVRNGRIEQMDSVASWEPYECAETRGVWSEVIATDWSEFAVGDTAGAEFWPVRFTLHDNRTLDPGLACGELAKPSPVTVSVTYRWDATLGRYAADRSVLDAVAQTFPPRKE